MSVYTNKVVSLTTEELNKAHVHLLANRSRTHELTHANPLGVYQTHIDNILYGRSAPELLTRAAFMHHSTKGYSTLKYHSALKALSAM